MTTIYMQSLLPAFFNGTQTVFFSNFNKLVFIFNLQEELAGCRADSGYRKMTLRIRLKHGLLVTR